MNAAPLPERHRDFRFQGPPEDGGMGLVGSSEAIERVRHGILRVASLEAPAFLSGEEGSGRREAARAIHRASSRGHLPIMIVECGAQPDGDSPIVLSSAGESGIKALVGSSQIGSLLLAGIDEAPLPVQRRFLQALGEPASPGGPGLAFSPSVKVRILATAGADYAERVADGHFLPSLSERLALLEVALPPLRSRIGDIPELVRHLVDRISRHLGRPAPVIDPEVESNLLRYSWPGNVRELRRVLEQALVLLEGRVLRKEDLPDFPGLGRDGDVEPLRRARRDFERQHIERALLRHGGDKLKAAKTLGVDLTTLYRILARAP